MGTYYWTGIISQDGTYIDWELSTTEYITGASAYAILEYYILSTMSISNVQVVSGRTPVTITRNNQTWYQMFSSGNASNTQWTSTVRFRTTINAGASTTIPYYSINF